MGAQPANVHVHRALAAHVCRSPDRLQQLFAGERPAGGLNKVAQEREFSWFYQKVRVAELGGMGGKVQCHRAAVQHRFAAVPRTQGAGGAGLKFARGKTAEYKVVAGQARCQVRPTGVQHQDPRRSADHRMGMERGGDGFGRAQLRRLDNHQIGRQANWAVKKRAAQKAGGQHPRAVVERRTCGRAVAKFSEQEHAGHGG